MSHTELSELFAIQIEATDRRNSAADRLPMLRRVITLRKRHGLPLVFGGRRVFHTAAQRIEDAYGPLRLRRRLKQRPYAMTLVQGHGDIKATDRTAIEAWAQTDAARRDQEDVE